MNFLINKQWRFMLYLVIFSLLVSCSGENSVRQMNKETETPIILAESQTPSVSDIMSTLTPTISLDISKKPTATMTPLPDTDVVISTLVCETYLETIWGSEPEQFGYDFENHLSRDTNWKGPFSLQLDEMGNMYVPDHVNNRIAVYLSGEKTPQLINLPDNFIVKDGLGNPMRSWRNFYVSHGKIYLLFIDDNDWNWKLSILTTKGEILQILEMDEYFFGNPMSSLPVKSDRVGGIFVDITGLSMGDIAYFDNNLNIQYNITSRLFYFDQLVIGFDNGVYAFYKDKLMYFGKTKDLHLSKFEKPEWNIGGLGSSINESIKSNEVFRSIPIGVDTNGNIFLMFLYKENKALVARFSKANNRMIFSDSYIYFTFYNLSLAPNGDLYALDYDQENPEIPPKILVCKFSYDLK